MAQQREKRLVLIVNEAEARTIRIAAAEVGVSVSAYMRAAALALARGQLRPDPRLPGFEEEPLPGWLTEAS